MTLRTSHFFGAAVFIASTLPILAHAQTPDDTPSLLRAESVSPAFHDHLPSLRDVKPKTLDLTWRKPAKDKRRVPYVDSPGFVTDQAAQLAPTQTTLAPAAATAAGINLDGIGKGFSGPQGTFTVQSAPPDTTGAAGATQYVQWVNSSFAVFNKATGAALYGPVPGNTLFSGFGGACETSNDGDPVVLYDKLADRWVLMQFAVPTGGPYFQCIAVSKTSDATGAAS